MEYDFKKIEANWKKYWTEQQVYKVTNTSDKPKCYVLDMFPYPSGAGLHVGHPLGYIASDIYARYKRLKGYNVLHPMGFDAFGLPAEQYAIETGQHPAVTTKKNIARYREQLDNIGFCYDWDRQVRTSDPKYYKWTQWIFLQLFHSWYDRKENKSRPIKELVGVFEKDGNKNIPCPGDETLTFDAAQWNNYSEKEKRDHLMQYRIAYQGYAQVWWCEALGTVLANDEVVNGVSERGGHPVERKNMRQWFLRITEYAERLLASLDTLDWTDAMKEMQRNWIGKSVGAEIEFDVVADSPIVEEDGTVWPGHANLPVKVFTTRPDTIFGVDFMVLAPEHELVDDITSPEQKEAVAEYKTYVKSRSERERMSEVKQITGCFTGAYAFHPFTEKQIPVWISEYVLAGYGTGAIMAVPSGDERDHAFAKHFNIPITNIFGDRYTGEEAYSSKTGTIENSDFLNGMNIADATEAAITELVKKGIGKRKVNFRLRDAGFSRQRYWGEPFPIIYVKDAESGEELPYAIDEEPVKDTELDELPVELPYVENYRPGPEGQGPLANLREWTSPRLSPQVERAGGRSEIPENRTNAGPKYSVHFIKQYELARLNRKSATEAEAILWQELRGNKLGEKFRRQHPVEGYIVDFVCLSRGLIIEADGGYHQTPEQAEYDKDRTRVLEELGFRVVRFTNEMVVGQTCSVIAKIKEHLQAPTAAHTDDSLQSRAVTLSNHEDVSPADGSLQSRAVTLSNHEDVSPADDSLQSRAVTLSNHEDVSPADDSLQSRAVTLSTRGEGRGEVSRETNTMPGYAGSSWYFLRYMDPGNDTEFAGRKATDYWNQVDLYIGGTEHAVGHLLYSRMWTKALYDLGHIGFDEPFKKLLNQGMIQGSSRFAYRVSSTNKFVSAGLRKQYLVDDIRVDVNFVDGTEMNIEAFKKWRPEYANAEFILENGKYICGAEVEKMSKSKYNVVNPDDIVAQYGADTFRMYEMFLGPIDVSKPWDTKGIEGVHRFLKKLWRLYFDDGGLVVNDEAPTDAELRILHKTIKKIGEDIERFSFNTSVSQFMICVNELSGCHKRAILERLAVTICPFAPHIAEELWHQLGHNTTVVDAPFPQYEERYVTDNTKKYPVAVNGKTRLEMEFPTDAAQETVKQAVLADEAIIKWMEGREVKKFIFVPGKMINVVV